MLKNRLRILTVLLILLSPSSLLAQQSTPQDASADLGAFIKEMMIVKMEDDRTHLVLWFPFYFFMSSAANDNKPSSAANDKEMEFLKPYLTISIQCSISKPD